MSDLTDVTDAQRIDPHNARRWSVSAAGQWTIVVATCKEEAQRLGLVWIAEHLGKSKIDVNTTARVSEATDEKVERWLTARAQQAESDAIVRKLKAGQ